MSLCDRRTIVLGLLFLASTSGAVSTVVAQRAGDKPSYARDVAPVFVERCYNCHGGGNNSGGLSLGSFERLSQGGNSGEIITAGEPGASLLIDKLRGTAGARMPLRAAPLDDEVIARIEAWIAAGAKYDGDDPAQATDQLVRTSAAARMSHDELAAERARRAAANWELALPGRKSAQHESAGCLVVGDVPEERLTEVGAAVEAAQRGIVKLFRLPAGAPLIKGRLTVFVFARRYDYGEFGRMVEKRELPRAWQGHARSNVLDAYACVMLPDDEVASLEADVARYTMLAFLESRGVWPGWFARGSSLAVAQRLHPKDPELAELTKLQRTLAPGLNDPQTLLDEKLPEEELDALSAGLAGWLLSDANRYRKLLDAVTAGENFDAAVEAAYGAAPKDLLTAWQKKAKGRR